ncbi:MAG: RloB domain-containing protein [Chlorobi bacterium]|nr:RloB domain-containing protein [Chlorobiota bacterium]
MKRIPKINMAIVAEGQTEHWYFQMFKRHFPEIPFNIHPVLSFKMSLQQQYEKVKEFIETYQYVFWIIDADIIRKKNQITRFRQLKKSLSPYENVYIILLNPCFEFWLLLHYKRTTKWFKNCQDVTKELKKFLPRYAKTRSYYTSSHQDILARTLPLLNQAMQNSRFTVSQSPDPFFSGYSEMHVFFEIPFIFQHINRK